MGASMRVATARDPATWTALRLHGLLEPWKAGIGSLSKVAGKKGMLKTLRIVCAHQSCRQNENELY